MSALKLGPTARGRARTNRDAPRHDEMARWADDGGPGDAAPRAPANPVTAPVIHPATPLPATAAERKTVPMCTGLLDYFPDALAAVAHVSYIGNMQHNPGEALHWARGKSTDEADTVVRHILQRGELDIDGVRHTAKAAWRVLALLQKELEAAYDLPVSRGSTTS